MWQGRSELSDQLTVTATSSWRSSYHSEDGAGVFGSMANGAELAASRTGDLWQIRSGKGVNKTAAVVCDTGI